VKHFEILLDEVRACTICAQHLPAGPRPVLQIDPAARLLIAGQAPGRKVYESGISFDDASGKRLREWMGITDSVFYDPKCVAILPMGFCYPGTGKSGDLPPRKECAPAWRDKLLACLPKLEMTLLIGQYAQAHHLPKTNATLTDTVKNWRDYWPHTIPLPHPSPRNNIWLKRNPWFERNLLPVVQQQINKILND